MDEVSWDIYKIGSIAGLVSFCWIVIQECFGLYLKWHRNHRGAGR